MPAFDPGLTLARGFYEEVVAPLVGGIEHSAALLGTGSDVLGFDTERSTDHAWGRGSRSSSTGPTSPEC